MTDFFISYSSDDSDWAQWIAWQLEEADYTTVIQAWDFPPGSDFVYSMDQASKLATRILLIFSKSFIKSEHANSEWRGYQTEDPSGSKSLIVPVKVRPCKIEGLLKSRDYINLVGITEAQKAIQILIEKINTIKEFNKLPELSVEATTLSKTEYAGSRSKRSKPTIPPIFPGAPASESRGIQKPIDYSHMEFLRVLEGAEDELFSIAFSPDGRWVAAGSNGMILMWDTALLRDKTNQTPPQPIPMIAPTTTTSSDDQGKYIYSVAFSHDSRRLVTGCEDGFVRVWDIDKKDFLWRKQRHSEAVYSVAFSPDGERVASGGYDKLVLIWDAKQGQLIKSSEGDFTDKVGRVTSIAFSPDGKILAVGSLADTVRLWNILEGTARILGRHDSSVEGVAFSPDGRLVASCGLDKAVRVWDIQNTEKPLKWFRKKHEYLVRSVAFSPDGKTLASVGWDKQLYLWDVENSTDFWSMPLVDDEPGHWHSDWVWSVAFAPGGKQLVSSGSDARIICWQVQPM